MMCDEAVLFTCTRSAPRGVRLLEYCEEYLAVANLYRDYLATCGVLRLSALYELFGQVAAEVSSFEK